MATINTSELEAKNIAEIKRLVPIKLSDVLSIARKYMSSEEIDHHGNGYGMDDLYLKKTEISKAIIDNIKTRSLITEFVNQIDGTVWYDLPFLYNEIEN